MGMLSSLSHLFRKSAASVFSFGFMFRNHFGMVGSIDPSTPRFLSLATMLCLLTGPSVMAQTAPVLNGIVQDTSGAVIPHARVRMLSSSGKAIQERYTDSEGKFRLELIGESGLTLQVTEAGFREVVRPIAALTKGGTPVVLTLPIQTEEVTVDVGNPASTKVGTDIATNQNATDLSRSALDRLPVFDADYITTLSRFLDQDSLATSGVSLVVNGVEANGTGVTASAVKSIKINQNPYSVLFARPGRARLELETEGGTSSFHGTVNYLERDALFDAQPAFAAIKPPERRDYVEGSLTGPLSHSKKTTFLASGQFDDDETQAIVLAALHSGAVNETVPNPIHHVLLSGRGFHEYGQSNQFWIGYSYERETDANLGVGGTVLPEAGSDDIYYEHEINVQDRRVFSPKLVNLGHFLIGHNLDRTSSTLQAAQINVPGSFTAGGAQADLLRTESHFDGTDLVTFSSGKQVLTFGMDVPDISRRGNDDFTNRQGTYSFNDLGSYQAKSPFQYTIQTGPGHVSFVEKVVAGVFADNIRASPRLSVEAGVRYYFQNFFNDVKHDVAPRLSFAFAPSAKGSTVIRGGAGVFFDRTGSTPIADLLHYNGTNIARSIVLNPSYPATSAQISGTPTSLVTLDPRSRIPYTLQYGIGVERQVTGKSSISLNYQGSRGIDLFRSVNTNAPLPPGSVTFPNAALGQVRQIQSEGYLKANSLELTFHGEPSRFFTGQAQ